jgi:hypothetical protein
LELRRRNRLEMTPVGSETNQSSTSQPQRRKAA